MRAPAVSLAERFAAALMAALLTVALLPASALAEGEGDTVDAPAEEPQEASASQVDEGADSSPVASSTNDGTLASALIGAPTTFVNSDVALDGEPVIGSFTVDGLTFAVTEGSDVELVGVSPDWQQVVSSQEGDGSPVAPMLASGHDADSSAFAVPESIAYEGVDYAVASIGAYAFYLSGVTTVELLATVTDVDDRAFRSSDVASVEVAAGNPSYSSFDGALYDAAQSSLLLIPEGKQGTVLLPMTAESAAPSVFSHCPLVTQVSVEEGSAAFASENGLLYDASLTTLLRVPAGATDIVIRDGCTTIAAGALEACASLSTITAPASVTSISPDVFTAVPTVSLPAVAAVADDPGASTGATKESSEQANSKPASGSATTQLTAMVALSSADDDLPEANPSSIEVNLADDAVESPWGALGLVVHASEAKAYASAGESRASVDTSKINIVANGGLNTIVQYKYDGTYFGTWNNAIQDEVAQYQFSCTGTSWSFTNNTTWRGNGSVARDGYDFAFWGTKVGAPSGVSSFYIPVGTAMTYYAIWRIDVGWDPNGGTWDDGSSSLRRETLLDGWTGAGFNGGEIPSRPGFRFVGWATEATAKKDEALTDVVVPNAHTTYFAVWEQIKYDLGFDVDSEPGDEDYLGVEKDDQTIVADQIEAGEKVEIADPKRPGYVFQGWVIPNTDGTEAIDQDLVYQDETDGKWYVDASKLPDYANVEGRVELAARWTSIISVDVPSAVTFYADVVTQGNESREGAASSAFGQNKVASQSEVDLRIVGLESTAVATQGSTLGADSILKKSASATPSSSTQKLFSLYPTDKALTADDLQDPDAVSQVKPSDAVDFALDDLLLERSFTADSFTIPAGDTLNLGYRLNLAETGTELDYDKLSTLDEGQSASIANISYCFAADYGPVFWTTDDDGSTLELAAIKADAEAIAAGDSAAISKYTRWMNADHRFYVKWYDKGVTEEADPTAATVYDVRIIGLNHDDKSDGTGKAGITFQFVDLLKDPHAMNYPTCNTLSHMGQSQNSFTHGGQYEVYGVFDSFYSANRYAHNTSSGGWGKSLLRALMNPGAQLEGLNVGSVGRDDDAIWNQLPTGLRTSIVPVDKPYLAEPSSGSGQPIVSKALEDRLFILGCSEMVSDGYRSGWASLAEEGETYEWYKAQALRGDADSNSILVKHQGDADGVSWHWWVRTGFPDDSVYFVQVNSGGAVSPFGAASSYGFGVCPAFCL